MPQDKGKPPPSSAKSSTAGLERRKHSQKGSQSAKTSPSREIAPFFSIFYRSISGKVKRSQSRAELGDEGGGRDHRDRDGGGGGGKEGAGGDPERMERAQGSRKYADKPPMPTKSTAQQRKTAVHASRSRSTVELAKEKAAAEGKSWRDQSAEPSTSPVLAKKAINSAQSSPQQQRRWPFGRGSRDIEKAQSQEPRQPQPGQNGYQPEAAQTNGFHHQLDQPDHSINGHQKQKLPVPSFKTFQPLSPEQKLPPPGPTSLTFAQRIKLHKGVRTGKIPVDMLKHAALVNGKSGSGGGGQHFGMGPKTGSIAAAAGRTAASFFGSGTKKASSTGAGKRGPLANGGVYLSADAIHELSNDPDYIAEALRTLGDEQPKVARSTPKHAFVSQDPKRVRERLRRDCLYPEEVYDKMVKDSLLVCDLLQSHLDEVISGVRARSPTAFSTPFTTPPGSPFMTRSTSMQIAGSRTPINRVTISVSPMAQQANPNPSPRPSASSLPPPFPISLSPPPLVRVTPASFRGEQFGSPRSEKRLQFVS